MEAWHVAGAHLEAGRAVGPGGRSGFFSAGGEEDGGEEGGEKAGWGHAYDPGSGGVAVKGLAGGASGADPGRGMGRVWG